MCDDPRVVDPALKESAFLTNIFNRLARSCFYGAAKACGCKLPAVEASAGVIEECREATLAFERTVHGMDFHGALAAVEEFTRAANKRWDAASKAAGDDADAYVAALADAFAALRTTALLMHPAVPAGCELVAEYMGFSEKDFFSWGHALATPRELAAELGEDASEHAILELPPRFDFFRKHESQYKK